MAPAGAPLESALAAVMPATVSLLCVLMLLGWL